MGQTYLKIFYSIFSLTKVKVFFSFLFFFTNVSAMGVKEKDVKEGVVPCSEQIISYPLDSVIASTIIYGEDTLPFVLLSEVNIYGRTWSQEERNRFQHLVYNVRRAYPYAKLAGERLKEYQELLEKAPNNKTKKKWMKIAEQEIKADFMADLKSMTISQGKILIKLIYRQTGTASYYLVKQLRGGFSAFFYQSFARFFGYNLKNEYDPQGEDVLIEMLVKRIENGELSEIPPNKSPALKSKRKSSAKKISQSSVVLKNKEK
ncbi:MAG: DUF4294 domain-containing protein [Bacteroidales bacterium]